MANKSCFYRIDGVVNANIFFYCELQSIQLPSIVRYLHSYIVMKKYTHLTLHAVQEYPITYVITRAFRDGKEEGLQASVPVVIKYLLSRQKENGSWGV